LEIYPNLAFWLENILSCNPEGSFLNEFSRLQRKVCAYAKSWRLANVGFGSVRAYRKVGALLLPRRKLTPTLLLKNCPQGSIFHTFFSMEIFPRNFFTFHGEENFQFWRQTNNPAKYHSSDLFAPQSGLKDYKSKIGVFYLSKVICIPFLSKLAVCCVKYFWQNFFKY
jgi:hypothetical protein